jgi:hypothetical protein
VAFLQVVEAVWKIDVLPLSRALMNTMRHAGPSLGLAKEGRPSVRSQATKIDKEDKPAGLQMGFWTPLCGHSGNAGFSFWLYSVWRTLRDLSSDL